MSDPTPVEIFVRHHRLEDLPEEERERRARERPPIAQPPVSPEELRAGSQFLAQLAEMTEFERRLEEFRRQTPAERKKRMAQTGRRVKRLLAPDRKRKRK